MLTLTKSIRMVKGSRLKFIGDALCSSALRRKCSYSEFLWPLFSCIWLEYGDLLQSSINETKKGKTGEHIYFSKTTQKQSPEVFCKKGVLKNFAKFTGKHLCQSLFTCGFPWILGNYLKRIFYRTSPGDCF